MWAGCGAGVVSNDLPPWSEQLCVDVQVEEIIAERGLYRNGQHSDKGPKNLRLQVGA